MKLTSIAVALFLSLSATAMPVADAEGDNAATPLPIADVEADTAAAIPVANVEAETPTTETPVAEIEEDNADIEEDNADIEEDTPDVEGDAHAALEARRVKCRFKKIGWKNVRCFYQGGDWSQYAFFLLERRPLSNANLWSIARGLRSVRILPSMPRILSSLRAISRTSLLAKVWIPNQSGVWLFTNCTRALYSTCPELCIVPGLTGRKSSGMVRDHRAIRSSFFSM